MGAVAACGEKSDEGMEEGGEMAPAAAATTADSGMNNMGGMAADSMSQDSTMTKPDSGSGEM
jgi:hypothetical protein